MNLNLRPLYIFISVLAAISCSKEEVNCSDNTLQVTVTSSTPPTSCSASDGSITVSVDGGASDVSFALNSGSTIIRQRNPKFTNLFPGVVKITATSGGCSIETEFELRLPTLSGVSYLNDVKPILTSNCNLSLCHDGSLGADRDWRSLEAITQKLNNIQRVLSLSKMPPPPNDLLKSDQVVKILCWIADGAPDN